SGPTSRRSAPKSAVGQPTSRPPTVPASPNAAPNGRLPFGARFSRTSDPSAAGGIRTQAKRGRRSRLLGAAAQRRVDCGGALPAFLDRPDDQGLAAARISRGEDPRHAGLVVRRGDVAAGVAIDA